MNKILTILLIMTCTITKAQNGFMYRQYVLNQLSFNPGYTGSREIAVASTTNRVSMIKVNGFPKTLSASFDTPWKNTNMAVGATILAEEIGNTRNYNIDLNYAYRVQVRSAGKLSLGLKFTGDFFTVNPLKNLIDTDDELFSLTKTTYFLPNAGFGMYFYDFNRYFIGVSIPTLLSYENGGGINNYSLQNDFVSMISNYHYIGSAGILLLRNNENIKVRLSTMAEFDISSALGFDVNTMFIIRDMIWLGGTYFSGQITSFMAQWQVSPQLKVGYAYDYTISSNLKELGGGHEIMLRYEFRYIINAVSPIF